MNDLQTPQPDSGMEKRLLLAFALTFLVIAIFQPMLFKKAEEQKQPTQTEQQQPPASPQAAPGATPVTPTPAVRGTKSAPAAPVVAKQAAAEETTVVENDLYRITFSNKGGVATSWILKKYSDDSRKPLELINPASQVYGFPLSLWTYDQATREKLNSALYVMTGQGTRSLTFEYSDGQMVVRKQFDFSHSYEVKVRTEVRQNGALVQAYPAWPAGFGDQTVQAAYATGQIVYQDGDKPTRVAPKKISGGNTIRQSLHWAGVADQYFAAVFLPEKPSDAALITLHYATQIPKDRNKPDPNQTVEVPVLGAAVGNYSSPTDVRLFVGPKDLDVLDKIHSSGGGPDLQQLVDFGFFGFIAKPLFLWLRWTHNHWVSNWGWAIVILTVIINIALFPLKFSSMKSALKMAKLAPEIDNIKKKYEKYSLRDPKRAEMNQELQGLYKREGFNPAAGCGPLLLQMPFLFAFYTMLAIAIELRHANWMWIKDLSSADPLYIMPVAIVITMFLVQKMTPQAGMDPAQQKMMNIMMPVMIGFISFSLASGLCLYWVIGNTIAIVQQLWMNQTALGREMQAVMAKRAAKKTAK